jgi:hypothetical protein
MASNFIQSSQLSPIQGSAGQQSVVQNQGPTAGEAINNAINAGAAAFDTAGTIYAKNQAQSLVNDELENVDSAIAIAERKAKDENFVEPTNLPVSGDEFKVIEAAVRSGAMSREKARLVASSRLRTRISEQPFFADKLRQAASNVVGFNIQSEPAQQYFASLPTDAQLAGGGRQTIQQKWMEEAQAIAASMPGVSAESIYRHKAQTEFGKMSKERIIAEREAGLWNDQQAFTRFNQVNSGVRFGNVMGGILQVAEADGSIKMEKAEQVLAQAKALEIQELEQMWTGDQTSTEFQRARQTIEQSYDDIMEVAESVGFDKLQQIKIDRANNAREILGNELFGPIKLLSQNLGSEIAGQAMETFANITDPARLEAMLRSNPALGEAGVILGNETAIKKFGDKVSDVYRSIAMGRPIPADGAPGTPGSDAGGSGGPSYDAVANTVFAEMFKSGPEGEKAALDYMREQGMQIKPISMLSQKAPGRAHPDSLKYFKTMYDTTLPEITSQFARVVAENPNLEWTINNQGIIELQEPQPVSTGTGGRAMREDIRATQRAQRGYDQARELVDHINLYGEAVDKGWGTVANTNPQLLQRTLSEQVDRGVLQAAQQFNIEGQNLVLEGDIEGARQQFDLMKRADPNYSRWTFEMFQEATRRKNVDQAGTQQEQ